MMFITKTWRYLHKQKQEDEPYEPAKEVVTSRKQTTIDHLPSGSRTWLAAKSPISMSFQNRQFLMGLPYDFPMNTSSQFAEFSHGSRKLGDVPIVFP